MEDNKVPLMVTIQCITYNHEPYIRQCMEGFVMQKANFRFEAIVHDDASTDGTVAIIREYAEKYPDIIKPIYETENQYSKHGFNGVFKIINKHTHGKYVALCEGDDYWIDPLKLQKQVDFLEVNPEYSMCCTDCYRYVQKTGEKIYKPHTLKTTITLEDLLCKNVVSTLTVLYRRNFMAGYDKLLLKMPPWPMGDYPVWIWLASKGPICRISEITAVYRILQRSASHSNDESERFFFGLASYDIGLFFCKYFNKNIFHGNIRRKYYILKFVFKHFWRQTDKLKYLFYNNIK